MRRFHIYILLILILSASKLIGGEPSQSQIGETTPLILIESSSDYNMKSTEHLIGIDDHKRIQPHADQKVYNRYF